jgi:hypothetical protein
MNNTINNNSKFAITVDLDWASETAIEIALKYFENLGIPITVFSTHNSELIRSKLSKLEVGLHPYFDTNSSHGNKIEKTIATVLDLPHNIKAYRCHRFAVSNEIQLAMQYAGMLCSSNVCTNLEVIKPFFNRINCLEIPIFMEDGGFLFNRYPLSINSLPKNLLSSDGLKTVVIHPMHLAVNTPNWEYMVNIKGRINRNDWNKLSSKEISQLQYRGRGIKDFFDDFFQELSHHKVEYTTIGSVMRMISITKQMSYVSD